MFSTIVLHNRGVCSCWEFQGASRNGGAFLTCVEGQDSQQLSELWFRQSVCWRQLTAAAQAASSLTRNRGVAVRFCRQTTCICHLLEQFSNGREAETGCGREARDRRGTFPKNFGCTARAVAFAPARPCGNIRPHKGRFLDWRIGWRDTTGERDRRGVDPCFAQSNAWAGAVGVFRLPYLFFENRFVLVGAST